MNKKVIITPEKIVNHPKGNIFHCVKSNSINFYSFGEAYITKILYGEVKGWKKHNEMILNLLVPSGSVRFYFFDQENDESFSLIIGHENYKRLTVMPNIWMAFEGLKKGENVILNIASIPHDPDEASNQHINKFPLI